MEGLPATVAEQLQALTYRERAVAYLQVDAELTLVCAGGNLEALARTVNVAFRFCPLPVRRR
jgi:hypothetical protein